VPAAAFGQPEVRRIDPPPLIDWEDQKRLPGMENPEFLQPDPSLARQGETLRQSEWRAELLKTGIRGKGGAKIEFVRVEALPGTRWLSADSETKEDKPRRAVISFGPEHAPLEQRQVELAWEEARTLSPRPSILAFAAFQFDPEAAKDIDELTREKTGMTFLKVQMNPDLLTEDLKKKRASNESFWLMGQPDVEVRTIKKGEHKGKIEVEVHGFDYYNTKTGQIESGDTKRIALWMLDPDYDGRSLFPRQVFFPMADDDSGWARLARNLKAEIDSERIEAYRGTVSLSFEAGAHKRVAVKIVDDRGIESLKIIPVP
jgi:adenine-specific DNA-methyltransferase